MRREILLLLALVLAVDALFAAAVRADPRAAAANVTTVTGPARG